MTINILGTDYTIKINNEDTRLKCDSYGFCDWTTKEIILADDYDDDESLRLLDEFKHKVIRHEAFHALFAEMGISKWLHDEELVEMLAMLYPKISKIMDECDNIEIRSITHDHNEE